MHGSKYILQFIQNDYYVKYGTRIPVVAVGHRGIGNVKQKETNESPFHNKTSHHKIPVEMFHKNFYLHNIGERERERERERGRARETERERERER